MKNRKFPVSVQLQSSLLQNCCLFLMVLFPLLFLTGCITTNHEMQAAPETSFDLTTLSESQSEYPFHHFPKYRIQPGDVLDVLFQIRTWTEKPEFLLSVDHTLQIKFPNAPELNEIQIIRPDGKVTLPYIGEKNVVGMTVSELTDDLKKQYSTILQDPDLYVLVPEFRSSIKELKADLHTAPRGLSRLVTVSPDGYVTFPMIGEMYVYSKSINEVNDVLNEHYDKIIEGLHVDLFLEKSAGSLITVIGEVARPGLYPITKPIPIVQALALAQGFLSSAELRSVVVVRRLETKLIATRVDVAAALDLKEGSRYYYLQPDDIVYVPKTMLTEAAEVARNIGDVLFFRGWSISLDQPLRNAPIY